MSKSTFILVAVSIAMVSVATVPTSPESSLVRSLRQGLQDFADTWDDLQIDYEDYVDEQRSDMLEVPGQYIPVLDASYNKNLTSIREGYTAKQVTRCEAELRRYNNTMRQSYACQRKEILDCGTSTVSSAKHYWEFQVKRVVNSKLVDIRKQLRFAIRCKDGECDKVNREVATNAINDLTFHYDHFKRMMTINAVVECINHIHYACGDKSEKRDKRFRQLQKCTSTPSV